MEFDISSVALIKWSDGLMLLCLLVQALLDNKSLLHLSYQSENNSIFQDYNACFDIQSLNVLNRTIDRLITNNKNDYHYDGFDNLMNEIVYNNNNRKKYFLYITANLKSL